MKSSREEELYDECCKIAALPPEKRHVITLREEEFVNYIMWLRDNTVYTPAANLHGLTSCVMMFGGIVEVRTDTPLVRV